MKNKFKVGDRVRIRQWDDMVKEFGLTDHGYIPFTKTCATTFTDFMKHLCGRTATIIGINYDTEKVDLDFDDNSGDTNWDFFLGAIEGEKTMDKQERIKELKKQIEEINAEINELERDDTLKQYESDTTWRYDGYILNERGCVNEDNDSIFNTADYNPYRHYMTEEYANKAAKIKSSTICLWHLSGVMTGIMSLIGQQIILSIILFIILMPTPSAIMLLCVTNITVMQFILVQKILLRNVPIGLIISTLTVSL